MRHFTRLNAQPLDQRITPDSSPHNLAVSNVYQNWNSASLIVANDNWSGVANIMGFLGADTFGEGVNPQTIITPYLTPHVIANQADNTSLTTGGVAEFDSLGVVALQPDNNSDAPNLVVSINTLGRSNIAISYNLRDLDSSADNAVQPFALQYRIGNSGNFINVPAGFVPDATTGPGLANNKTLVNATLPSAVDNQAEVQVRILTTNATGEDEWVGIDDIVVGAKELVINTTTAKTQRFASVAMDDTSRTYVAWQSIEQDGSGYGIYLQRYSAAGTKVGGELQVNTYTMKHQRYCSIAVDPDGDAWVVWESDGQDGSQYGIYGQRVNADGAKTGPEFQVNTYTTGIQNRPSVALDADGDAIISWGGFGVGGLGVYGQRFNATGMKMGGEFQISTSTKSGSTLSVAVDSDGDAVTVWNNNGKDGSSYGVLGQRMDGTGSKVNGEFQVNTSTANSQSDPSIAMNANGNAVVSWTSDHLGGYHDVYAQRFDASGTKVGEEFQVNTYTRYSQHRSSVAVDGDGDFSIVWESHSENGTDYDIFLQRFDATGAKIGEEFQLNTYARDWQSFPKIAMNAQGDAVIVWNSDDQDGSDYGVYTQRFQSPNPPVHFVGIQINDGSPQRSNVMTLQVAFDSTVSFIGNPSSAFTLVNQTNSNAVTLSANLDPPGKSVTLTFTGGPLDFGSLADGRYTLTINGNQIAGFGFDGNGDGITGDNYTLVGSPANGLFRLFGDSDGNGTVNAIDFALFRGFFGLTGPSIFDFNNDGQTNAADFAQFRGRFGITLAP